MAAGSDQVPSFYGEAKMLPPKKKGGPQPEAAERLGPAGRQFFQWRYRECCTIPQVKKKMDRLSQVTGQDFVATEKEWISREASWNKHGWKIKRSQRGFDLRTPSEILHLLLWDTWGRAAGEVTPVAKINSDKRAEDAMRLGSLLNPSPDTIKAQIPNHQCSTQAYSSPDDYLLEPGYQRWTEHPFKTEPPFMLWRLRSGSWCPRFLVSVRHPFTSFSVPALFPLEVVCQMIHQRRLAGGNELPKEREFIRWFDKIQTQLPGNITLRDPWLYPDQGEPVDDTLRRRAWTLLSLVGSQIDLPDTVGLVFLKCVNIDYEPFLITLEVSNDSDSTDTQSLPFPEDLRSGDEAFDVWLRKAEMTKLYPPSSPDLSRSDTQPQRLIKAPRATREGFTFQNPPSSTVERPQAVVGSPSICSSARSDYNRSNNDHNSREYSSEASYDISIHSHTRKWDPHPFLNDPPFVLWRQGESGPYYPRMIVVQNDPLSRFLGIGVLAIEEAYPKIHRALVSVPNARSLLSWFRGLQELHLGVNISLLDPWIYPNPKRPGVESFRWKFWALLSMIDSPIIFPNFGVDSWYIAAVEPDYRRLNIEILVRHGTDARMVPLSPEIQSDDKFETWLGTIDLQRYPAYITKSQPNHYFYDLDTDLQQNLIFCVYFANHLFTHAQVHKVLQLRYGCRCPLTVDDIRKMYYFLLTKNRDNTHIFAPRSSARALSSMEIAAGLMALKMDYQRLQYQVTERIPEKRGAADEDPIAPRPQKKR